MVKFGRSLYDPFSEAIKNISCVLVLLYISTLASVLLTSHVQLVSTQQPALSVFPKMKVKVISRSEEDFTKERSQDVAVRTAFCPILSIERIGFFFSCLTVL